MKLEPIARQSLVDVVAERIRGLIDRGHMEPGDRLPGELDLVEQLQVSRPVLREAISRLESVGLVTVRRGRGIYVGDRGSLSSCVKLVRTAMSIAPKEVLRLTELRTAIEVHAARLAAERATPEEVVELEELCRQMDREDVDHLEAIEFDFRFHRKIVAITGNEMMENIMHVIHEFVMAGMIHTTPNPRNRRNSKALHGAILDAIRSGDAEAAEKAMKAHMGMVSLRLEEADERRKQPAVR
ncbi:MAG: FadR family transcriptional regulator [Gemmataceae bacterium]|nr:FadR family transcriptional regulator [Gemmataceae bacterium]